MSGKTAGSSDDARHGRLIYLILVSGWVRGASSWKDKAATHKINDRQERRPTRKPTNKKKE